MKLGVMGGTFDPVHYGHLVVAEGVRYEYRLDKVIFVPAGRPPHKADRPMSGPEHRLTITALAIASNPYFEVSDLEIKRPGLSYTYDTIRELQSLYRPEVVYFITGADAVLELLSWHRIRELLAMCRFIAATRPGYNLENLTVKLKLLPASLVERIVPVEVPALAISSSDIRRRVSEGRPIKYLLPEGVEEYVLSTGLYRQGLHQETSFCK
ncbi:nicotinate-nucleotide adenylyltransferase [Candidatus Desulforudis audaxviator]|uniref:Probable nicotinate-nucleotide adenylyltransferase n=1 Tax=Desulforudis audaxviator (strain MP104C) TaxID=477974 RepID=B1I5S0_DESAP|nr:nicotinate-nucleotide adenylyltransferase [Candidatus Desulforudis audaxviator]ACA60361.1 nicotinate (nicotinamide) nucleotide adenylyltransferase [Candidatus Desulforudis audaxviator MP104C]AZK60416.1 Nicotinate-nucleotide adenylyltransferase [Candidatus Desulforudis audaxviator]